MDKSPLHPSSAKDRVGAVAPLSAVFISLGILSAASVQAQQTPPSLDPGQLLKQEQNQQIAPQPQTGGTTLFQANQVPLLNSPSVGSDLKIRITSVRFTGKISQPEAVLLELVRPALNKELNFADIQALADKVTLHYRNQGFFLAQVLVPAQEISEGRLTLNVIEGRLGQQSSKVLVKGHERTDETRIAGTLLAPLNPDTGLKESELERGILLLNDLPGVKAAIIVEPGEEPESSRLSATVTELGLVRGSVSLDNAGNRFTGALRAGLNVFADNLTGQGDQLFVQASKAVQGNFSYGRLGYQRPVGYSGLVLGVSASSVDYTSGKELENLDAKGDAQLLSLNAQYPLVRSRQANLVLTGSVENRLVKSQSLGVPVTDKKFDVMALGLQGDYTDGFSGGGVTSGGVTLTSGKLDLDRIPGALAADQDTTGPKTQGNYSKLNLSLLRLQSLSDSTVGQFTFNAQYSNENLDSGEKFSLGGPSGLESYQAGEGLGDRAYLLGLEVRKVLFKGLQIQGFRVGDMQFRTFYDIGNVTQFVNAPSTLRTPNNYWLRSAGVGLNFGESGVYDLRIALAKSLGDNPGADINGNDSSGRSKSTRVTVFTTIYF